MKRFRRSPCQLNFIQICPFKNLLGKDLRTNNWNRNAVIRVDIELRLCFPATPIVCCCASQVGPFEFTTVICSWHQRRLQKRHSQKKLPRHRAEHNGLQAWKWWTVKLSNHYQGTEGKYFWLVGSNTKDISTTYSIIPTLLWLNLLLRFHWQLLHIFT